MIILEDLTKIYFSKNDKDIVVFDKINFIFPSKGFITLTGKSGSGKSTLFNILGGIDTEFVGSVKSFGVDISKCDLSSYRSEYVGFIFQDFSLIENLTVYENLKLVLSENKNLSEDINDKIDDVLAKLGLLDLKLRYPNQISGGEGQRVAIARALLKDVKYILADEPTGNLDKENAVEVLNLLKKVSKEKLVILVTHDIDLASSYSDRTHTIEELINGVPSTLDNSYIEVTQEVNEKKLSSFVMSYPFRMLTMNKFSTILMNVLLFFVLSIAFLSLKTIAITDRDVLSIYFNSNENENYSVQEVTVVELDNGGLSVKSNILINDVYDAYNYYSVYTDKENVLFSNKIRFMYFDSEGFERPLVTRITLLEGSNDYPLSLKDGRLPVREDELVITDYMSMLFFDTEDSVGNKVEGVFKSRYSNEFIIVGVIDTDYSSKGIPLDYEDFITMFEHITVFSPETSFYYFELTKYIQSFTVLETYSLKDEHHLLGSEAYLNINCDSCEQNYRITSSMEHAPTHNMYGSYPDNDDEIVLRVDILSELLPSNAIQINQLINDEITWTQFAEQVDLPTFYNDIALTSGEDFWDGVLPVSYNITGVFVGSDDPIEMLYVSPNLIGEINSNYPFREIGITILNPNEILGTLTNESFIQDIQKVYSPNTGTEQIVFNGLNSHELITSQYRFSQEVQPQMLISFIVTVLLMFILLLLHGSNSFKIYGRSIGILMSLGFSKGKLIIALVIEVLYLLLLPLIASIVLLTASSRFLSQILFSNELQFSIFQFSLGDVITYLVFVLVISLISMLPRLISIFKKSPIDLIRKR